MAIIDNAQAANAPHGTNLRAALYASHLQALRLETLKVRCQLDNPRNGERRALLALRLDAVDARAADLNARLIEATAA
jgi:hypothetical protein